MDLKRILTGLSLFCLLSSAAFAEGVDLSRLSANGVAPGTPTAQAQKVLGKPASVKGSKKQFLLYPGKGAWGRLTLELTPDGKAVAFVQNGSTLALDGKPILKIGDPVAALDKALPGTPHFKREKVDSWEYVYKQPSAMLVVVVKDGRIADFVLGAPSGE